MFYRNISRTSDRQMVNKRLRTETLGTSENGKAVEHNYLFFFFSIFKDCTDFQGRQLTI